MCKLSIAQSPDREDDSDMTYLAMDIGASSGKLIRSCLADGKIKTEVVCRFENSLIERNGHLCWDIDRLYDEMVAGLRLAGKADWISIDTWAVDYVLLDGNGKRISDAVSYRDSRTDNVSCPVSRHEMYQHTGIQYQKFNTVYQLLAQKEEEPEIFERAEHLLFVPDYLAYRLTGKMCQEYTNASTTGLLKAGTREWDAELIERLGLKKNLFKPLTMSGTVLGPVTEDIGYDASFILAPTHDTACAVLACPLTESSLYLSSGTWSLLGTVSQTPYTSRAAEDANLTNEGADDGKIRLLKNIMGTWMFQNVRKENGDVSFSVLQEEAEHSQLIGCIDALDDRFLSPSSMTDEIASALSEQGLRKPRTRGETANVIYHSLALAYRKAAEELSAITGRTFTHLAIAGGGSKDSYLNALTARYTGLEVTAGPVEASAAGNILSAMIHTGLVERAEAKDLITSSFDIKTVKAEE